MANPTISIMRDEVYSDGRRVGRISSEGAVRRFFYWPDGDEAQERPVTGDLSLTLRDEKKTVATIVSALAAATATR